ncbi:hypothetical protein [Photobacterium phosphoreum]|uniref:hypothetical protein n=1 Tax=Photobacterium phosphoreum TaxID=659 RepID=UPI000D17C232|nr:hypothetical protein [Photobacterium phosphoreum]PSU59429.1 hypothetical protein CTM75_15990 [Photobacterium phosphoreum]PSW36680.1 hypothetical protein CTM70_18455 [Photobacterium phosphoreum]
MIIKTSQEIGIKLWVELLIFISSYYPLFLILFIRDIGSDSATIPFGFDSYISYWAVGGLLISSICTLVTAFIMRKLFSEAQGSVEIILTEVTPVRGDMLNYTLPFLIGLFAFDYKTLQSIASLFVFLLFMFAFTRKEKIIVLNPMFLLLGIRLFEIKYRKVGQPNGLHAKTALCMGIAKASTTRVRLLENSGINFISTLGNR